MNLILFVAKIFLCSGILFAYYLLFLRNKRFHHYNRFYLLAIVIISLVFPFLEISVSESSQNIYPGMHQAIDLISVNNWEGNWNEENIAAVDTKEPILTSRNIALFAYALGLIFLFTLLIKSIYYIIRIRRKYNAEPIGDLKLYNTVEPGTPFSFFKSIFWNHHISFNSKEGQQIFRHELFHVRQHHSSDALFMEIVCIICWFNPFFHLIRKELKAIHEFLADQYAISDNDRYAYAELLVLESIRQKKVSFVHPFFQNNIKRRIAMITQFNKTRYGYWSRVMALPILILLFCIITLKAQQKTSVQTTNESEKAIQSITVLVDAGHGGKDPGAYSPDQKHVEKDIALAIAKKIKEKAASYNVNVIMTREDDNAPDLKTRTDHANQVKPDLLVSIHVGAEPPMVVKGETAKKAFGHGIMIYNPKAGSPNEKQSKSLSGSLLHSIAPVYHSFSISNSKTPVWIIDKAPCPAVLLECGNISHKADLEFILNESNQEKIAEAILKGIVEYKSDADKKQAYNSTEEEVIATETEVPEEIKEVSGPVEEVSAASFERVSEIQELSVADINKETLVKIQDDIKKYIAKHFVKTIRYPAEAREKNEQATIDFAVELDKNGKIWSIDIFKPGSPKGADVQEIVIVGEPGDKTKPVIVKSVAHDKWEKELDRSIKSFEAPANVEIKPGKYYFRAVFTLNWEGSATNVSVEPVNVVGTKITSPVNAQGKVNVQSNLSEVTVVGYAKPSLTSVNNVQVKPVIVEGQVKSSVQNVEKVNLQNASVSVNPVVVEGQAKPSIKNAVNEAVTVQGYKKVSPRSEPLPIDLIRKFKAGETTLDFVKKELGDPSNQFLDSYVESLAYYGNNERLMLTFSREDGRLINYSYNKNQHTRATLNYDDVKLINKGTTHFKDVLKKFGKPTEINIDNNTEGWIYISENARLIILTNDKSNAIVHQMSFDKSEK